MSDLWILALGYLYVAGAFLVYFFADASDERTLKVRPLLACLWFLLPFAVLSGHMTKGQINNDDNDDLGA
jgi:hypothetical protein